MLNVLPEATECPEMPSVKPPKDEGGRPPSIRDYVLGAVARGWCSKENEKKTMDVDLAKAITDEILKMPCEPNLGCATTKELLEEVTARIELDGNLDYRTVD